MTWLLEGAAVLCLLYYGIIASYSGVATSFALFWPIFAIILAISAGALHYYRRHPEHVPMWVAVGAVTICSAFAFIFIVTELLIGLGAVTATKAAVDYVIVLGAQVKDEQLSNSLKKRLDKALKYAENNPNTILVLSGGQGPGESVTEAHAMYQYLRFNGVPDEQLLLEERSTNTKENIIYSKEVIEDHEHSRMLVARENLQDSFKEREAGDIKIAVLTNNFHVFRGKEIAKKQGLGNVHGISASCDGVLAVHFWVRECFAVLKDKFMGAM